MKYNDEELSGFNLYNHASLFTALTHFLNFYKIIGEPSNKLMEDMGQEEKDRVAEQRKKLGEEGLKKMADTVEAANEENEVTF